MTLVAGDVVAGRYKVVDKLGEGGMGAVYRAVQEPLGREVALKVIAPALTVDADAVARFHREAKASSSLTHPNIVTVYDFGTDSTPGGGSTLFLAMELLSGQGLDALVALGPTTPARAMTILRGICAALAEAHGKGIVHRDLKPQNVMLTSTSTQQDIAKVVDFGIAKMKDGGKTLTATGAVVGTPGYVAPELFDGKEPSSQSDLYALGVVAYELVCGQAPFPGKTPMELIKAALFTDPLPMRAFLRDVPTGLEQLVRDLLQKDPARRPASARVVDERLAALQHAAQQGPLSTSQSHADLAPDQATDMNIERVDDPTTQKPATTATTPNEAKHLVEKLPTAPQIAQQIALTPAKKQPEAWGFGKVLLVGCGSFLFLAGLTFFIIVVAAVITKEDDNDEEGAAVPVDVGSDIDMNAAFAADAGVDFAKIQQLMEEIEKQQQQRNR